MSTHICPLCRSNIEINLNIPCPACGAQLAIKLNRKTKSPFIACMAYPDCKWATSVQKYLLWSAGMLDDQGKIVHRPSISAPAVNRNLRKITIGFDELDVNADDLVSS